MNNVSNQYGVIYKITNLINNKVYIGQTIRKVERRIKNHLNWKKKDGHFLRAVQLYKKENFKWEVVEICDSRDALNIAEKYWIKYYNSNNPVYGYNLTEGGEGSSGVVVSQETREKIRSKALGRKASDKTKEKLRKIKKEKCNTDEYKVICSERIKGDKNPMYNRSLLDLWKDTYGEELAQQMWEEKCKEVSSKLKNREFTPEWIQKIKEATIGRVLSEETKIKIGKASKGRIHSKETKQKISLSKKGKKRKSFNDEWKKRLGMGSQGSKHHLSKLSEQEVYSIKVLLSTSNLTTKEIASQFKVSTSIINNIKKGRTWKHVLLEKGDINESDIN